MAAKAFFVHINFNGNEIQNVLLERLASDPTLVEPRIWYNTTDNQARYFNGTQVIDLESTIAAGVSSQVATLNGQEFTFNAATGSTAGFMSAADKAILDTATDAATVNAIIRRDANGRAKVVDGVAATDIATIGQVEILVDATLKAPEAYDPTITGLFPVTFGGNAVQKGDSFRITAAQIDMGTTNPITVNAEDLLIALIDTPAQDGNNWMVAESNRDQATELLLGVARLATQALTNAGINDLTIVTPLKLETFVQDTNIPRQFAINLDSSEGAVVRVFAAGTTTYTITHTLNTLDMVTSVKELSSGELVTATITVISVSVVTVAFNGNSADNTFRVTLIGE